MSIIKNNIRTYEGAVIGIDDHYWMDGMISEYAIVWDKSEKDFKSIEIGYYGSDGRNFMENTYAEVDCNVETAREIIRATKQKANVSFEKSVIEYKNTVHKGDTVEVVRGRKVKKGTKLTVFWIGEKPTYRANNSPKWGYYANETGMIAGCKTENNETIWIKAEYLKGLNPPKSPKAKERNKYIRNYVERQVSINIRNIAKGM